VATIQQQDDYETRRWGHGGESRVIELGGARAGTGLSYLFPLSVEVALLSVAFKLTTDGNVANRQVLVKLFDGNNTQVFNVPAPGTQAATLTVSYSFAPMVQPFGSAALGAMGGPFIGARLPGNLELFVGVAAAQAGDAITGAVILVRQWPAHQDVLGGSAAD
jgi:hypothetical protein